MGLSRILGAIIFTWALRMGQTRIERILIHALELNLWHFEVFYAHALLEWAWPHAHINMTTFTIFAQKCNTGCLLALYGSISM